MPGRKKATGVESAPPPDPDVQLGDLIGYRIRKLNTLLTQHSKELSTKVMGLTLAQSRVLYELGFGGPTKPAKIATNSGLERSHVTQAAHALVQLGLLLKMADPTDGRGVLLYITPKGLALLNRGLKASEARRKVLNDALTQEQRVIFNEALGRLTAAAETLIDEPVATQAQANNHQ